MKSENRGALIKRAGLLYLYSLSFVGSIIFLPAGTLKFWNGWLFMAALFIPMFFVLIYLLLKDPYLLAKRMKTNEKEKTQKVYLFFSIVISFITFIIPGLDFRLGWSDIPFSIVILSTIMMMTGYLLFFLVMRQNTFASRVIEIQDDQKLIDTGLYSIVRHPMYMGATIMFAFMPLVLGSFYALVPMAFIPVLLIIRIMNEEKVLVNGLKGYGDYMKKVKYRLIPFIW